MEIKKMLYSQVSTCPKCGAPVYVDAESNPSFAGPPIPIYSCMCHKQSRKPSDGQLIRLLSHTIGSIGQIFKDRKKFQAIQEHHLTPAEKEIKRIYDGYIEAIKRWS